MKRLMDAMIYCPLDTLQPKVSNGHTKITVHGILQPEYPMDSLSGYYCASNGHSGSRSVHRMCIPSKSNSSIDYNETTPEHPKTTQNHPDPPQDHPNPPT
ncbi:hypothetical protein PGTUg99_033160 [Puccinia graminis f. sp. tritici]|uniref:Uncharacterized protein n=1 Tax=Puccinia graminis f. sp. tritici TaxID=56615 RepID=A0A5B0PM44_PUCGR|nr:hypothetical protein PGTUg99_033160 [Puccinia graminis f. sp. tritici]